MHYTNKYLEHIFDNNHQKILEPVKIRINNNNFMSCNMKRKSEIAKIIKRKIEYKLISVKGSQSDLQA